jgi:hypothetical protein
MLDPSTLLLRPPMVVSDELVTGASSSLAMHGCPASFLLRRGALFGGLSAQMLLVIISAGNFVLREIGQPVRIVFSVNPCEKQGGRPVR